MEKETFDGLYNQILNGSDWDYSTLDKLIAKSDEETKRYMIDKAEKAYCKECVWKGESCVIGGEKCKWFGRFSFNLRNS